MIDTKKVVFLLYAPLRWQKGLLGVAAIPKRHYYATTSFASARNHWRPELQFKHVLYHTYWWQASRNLKHFSQINERMRAGKTFAVEKFLKLRTGSQSLSALSRSSGVTILTLQRYFRTIVRCTSKSKSIVYALVDPLEPAVLKWSARYRPVPFCDPSAILNHSPQPLWRNEHLNSLRKSWARTWCSLAEARFHQEIGRNGKAMQRRWWGADCAAKSTYPRIRIYIPISY